MALPTDSARAAAMSESLSVNRCLRPGMVARIGTSILRLGPVPTGVAASAGREEMRERTRGILGERVLP